MLSRTCTLALGLHFLKNLNNDKKIYDLAWHFRIDEPEGTWIDVNTLPKNPYE